MLNTIKQPGLKRSLGLGLLVFYGLGVIIGAGIYVVIGDVVQETGPLAVLSFVIAGALAGLTGLCYAELGARYPEAAGATAYVKEAFGSDRLSQLTGFVVAAVVLVTAATIAHGAASYAKIFVPLPDIFLAVSIVILFTAVSCLGVKNSVRAAAIMTVIELTGLALVVALGSDRLPDFLPHLGEIIPARVNDWSKVFPGAFLAFFAFTGFENLANMAEEAEDAGRTIPRAILLSLGISTLVYIIVAFIVVAGSAAGSGSGTILLSVLDHHGPDLKNIFTGLAVFAVANGVLIQILMLARLFYGMSRRELLPSWLSALSKNHVPVRATLLAGTLIVFSTYALDFESLLRVSTTLTLCVFTAVSLSLWRLKAQGNKQQAGFQTSLWIPVLATFGNILLIGAQFILS